jgi:hypothetical protein
MARLKITRMLECLDNKERNQWLTELGQQRGLRRPDLLGAARFLVQRYQQSSGEHPDTDGQDKNFRGLLFEQAFPGQAFDDLKLRHLSSELVRDLEQFLVRREVDLQPFLREIFLLRALRKRQLNELFESGVQRLDKKLEDNPLRNTDYHYNRFLLEAERSRFLEGQKIRTVEPNLQKASDALDTFYMASKLAYASSMLNHSGVVQSAYRFDLMEEVASFIQQGEERQLEDPAIGAYYHVWCMLSNRDAEEHFRQLCAKLPQEVRRFQPEEARDLYVHAINYCIKRMRAGAPEYLREAFELYRDMLRGGVFSEDGYMSPWMYKNVTVAGLRLGESAWVEEFVERYRSELHPQFRDTAYSYNSAKVAFARGKHGRVLELLQEVEYQDIFYALDARAMLLKTYYELGEYEALESLCSSFRVFLNRRREVPESHRRSYLTLIRLVRLAQRVRNNRDRGLLHRLEQSLASQPDLLDRGWLMEKFKELEVSLASRVRR